MLSGYTSEDMESGIYSNDETQEYFWRDVPSSERVRYL